jgi:hypothetical protein
VHVARLDRRGDDDALRAAVEVPVQRFGRQELAGALQHDVDAEVSPGDLGRAGVRREREPRRADAHGRVAVGRDRVAPATLHAVELEQVRRRGRAALDLVEVHDVEAAHRARVVGGPLGSAEGGAQRQTADAAHAVDTHAHDRFDSFGCAPRSRTDDAPDISRKLEI